MLFKGKLSIKLLLFGVLFCLTTTVKAQSAMDLRINEILVVNQTNYIDDFGQRSPWIEIYNTAFNSVNMAGLYLTDDLNNPKKYYIAKGNPLTKIPPQGYLVFWADDQTEHGIRHLNFNLTNSKLIAIFDSDGKTLIDVVHLNISHRVDTTYGRLIDGGAAMGYLKNTTPGANNNTAIVISSAQQFGKMDPLGIGMAMIAMSIVFIALAILYLFFKRMGKVYQGESFLVRRKKTVEGVIQNEFVHEEMTGEVNAAIAMSLYLYRNQLHDHENTILTIRKVSRTYSPWSSKIYGVMNSHK